MTSRWAAPTPLSRESMPETTHVPLLDHNAFEVKLVHPSWSIKQATLQEPGHTTTGRLTFPATSSDGHVPQGSTGGPVPLATLAEVTRLVNIIIIEVTKFGLHALASWAWYDLFRPLFFLVITFVIRFLLYLSPMQRNRCPKQLDSWRILGGMDLVCHDRKGWNFSEEIENFHGWRKEAKKPMVFIGDDNNKSAQNHKHT